MATAQEPAALPRALERLQALLEPGQRPVDPDVAHGYLDLIGVAAPKSTGVTQDLMLTGIVPAIYERWWRPALGRVAKGVLGPGMADEHRIARLLLGLAPGDGVLDVACGPGNFTREFGRSVGAHGLSVGIDASPTMLARAVRDTRLPDDVSVAYVRGDAVALPFRAESFDAVCCFAALHLFAAPFEALDHMTRLLTPGGRIALFTSCRTRSAPLRTIEGVAGARSGMRLFEPDEITGALEQRGFEDVSQRVAGLTQFVGGRRS
jgi:SAM-dependent methyltransferase